MASTFKHPLVAFREANRLSQSDAAALVGVTQGLWSRLETGDVFAGARVARRISKLTGVSIDRLMDFEDDNEPVADAIN